MKPARVLLAALVPFLACGEGAGGPAGPIENPEISGPGDYDRLLASSGGTRGYSLHVPPGWDGTSPLPILLVFHGVPRGDVRALTGFDEIADERGFAVAYPRSRDQDWAVGCTACTNAARSGIDDVQFVEDVLDDLAAALPLDSTRIWAVGFFQGALLSHFLACEIPDRIAAFASVAATMIEQVVLGCEPARQVPWMFVHGSEDPVLPAAGESGPRIWSPAGRSPSSSPDSRSDSTRGADAVPQTSATPLPAVVRGRHAGAGAEGAGQMALVGEAGRERDGRDRLLGSRQPLSRPFRAQAPDAGAIGSR